MQASASTIRSARYRQRFRLGLTRNQNLGLRLGLNPNPNVRLGMGLTRTHNLRFRLLDPPPPFNPAPGVTTWVQPQPPTRPCGVCSAHRPPTKHRQCRNSSVDAYKQALGLTDLMGPYALNLNPALAPKLSISKMS